MLFVLVLDGAGYLMAVNSVDGRAQGAAGGARGHLRRRRPADDKRGPGPAGHDHAHRDRGQRGGEAIDVRNAARVLPRHGGAGARRPRCRARVGQHRAGQDPVQRRARRDGRKLQRPAGGGEGGGARPRRGAREDAHGALGAAGEARADRPSRPSRCADGPAEPHRPRDPPGGDLRSRQGGGHELRDPDRRSRSFQGSQRRLRARGRRRAACARSPGASQAAAQGAFIARIGGDEFTLLLATGEQPAAAEALADRLLKSLDAGLRRARPEDSHRPQHRRGHLSRRTRATSRRCWPMPMPRSTGPRPTGGTWCASSTPTWIAG